LFSVFRCVKVPGLQCLSMPVLTPVVAWSRAVTLPVPLEPDIEHLRSRHGNTTTSLCFALIGQLQLSPSPSSSSSSSSSSLLWLSQLNCSLPNSDDDADEEITWWFQQLALGRDPVYYLLPVVVIIGIVCDTLATWLLARLLLRTPTRCHNDVTSDVFLLWLTLTSDLWLACAAIRALPDYVTGHVIDSLQWTDGYAAAACEWLSYTCLWLLLTMSLNTAVRLSASQDFSHVRTEHHQTNRGNHSNHTQNHHHHHHLLHLHLHHHLHLLLLHLHHHLHLLLLHHLHHHLYHLLLHLHLHLHLHHLLHLHRHLLHLHHHHHHLHLHHLLLHLHHHLHLLLLHLHLHHLLHHLLLHLLLHNHHHHRRRQQEQHHQQQQHQRRDRCRQMFVCVAIHIICIVSSLPQFFAYQLVDSHCSSC